MVLSREVQQNLKKSGFDLIGLLTHGFRASSSAMKSPMSPDSYTLIQTHYVPKTLQPKGVFCAIKDLSGTTYSITTAFELEKKDKRERHFIETNLPLYDALDKLEELEKENKTINKYLQSTPYNPSHYHYSSIRRLLIDWPDEKYFSKTKKGQKQHKESLESHHRKFEIFGKIH